MKVLNRIVCRSLVFAAVSSAQFHSQRAHPRALDVPHRRAINLGDRTVHQLAIDASHRVVIGGQNELIRIDLFGKVELEELADIGYGDLHGASARALSSDARFVAGIGLTDDNFHSEATWWNAGAPGVPQPLGGVDSALFGVENTPTGPVMVGIDGGDPIDARPEGRSVLPVLLPWSGGRVNGLSADGSVYCGYFGGFGGFRAGRWIGRVPDALADLGGTSSEAAGVSRNGSNFAGSASDGTGSRPVVWLAAESWAIRTLRRPDGSLFSGRANGILNDGFTYGESSSSPRFAWVWHPSFGTDEVMRFDDWLALWGMSPVDIQSVRDVHATRGAYHFSLMGDVSHDSWYVQTPKGS